MTHDPAAIVTGAGSGIGRATALLLAQRGYRLALAGRTPGSLTETAKLIGGDATRIITVPTDVTDPAQLQNLVDETVRRFRRLDVLVNNAGYASLVNLADLTPDEVKKTLDVNIAGPMLLTAYAWKHLAASNGLVVNVSSVAALDPFPGLRAYGAAKAAINLFTKSLADEGLRAVAILPGAVETPLLRSIFDESAIPKGAAMSPQVIAEAIVACVTGERAFDNGGCITIASQP